MGLLSERVCVCIHVYVDVCGLHIFGEEGMCFVSALLVGSMG